MARYTIPTSNTTFPPTLKDCDQNPRTCPFMEGNLLDNTMYDAECKKPIERESVTVFVEGFNVNVGVPKENISRVFCGKCHYSKGVEREV